MMFFFVEKNFVKWKKYCNRGRIFSSLRVKNKIGKQGGVKERMKRMGFTIVGLIAVLLLSQVVPEGKTEPEPTSIIESEETDASQLF